MLPCPHNVRSFILSFPTRRSSDLSRKMGQRLARRRLDAPLPYRPQIHRTNRGRKRLASVRGGTRRVAEPEHHHRSEEHTSELQSPCNLVCRLLLEKKNNIILESIR